MAAKRLKLTSTDADSAAVQAAAQVVNAGGIAVMPLETVYCAMARVDHTQALADLRRLRSLPADKPIALHVADAKSAEQYIDPPSPYQHYLMSRLWPGPVGMVFAVSREKREEVTARLAVAEHDVYDAGQITIRCPAHAVARKVVGACPHPLAAVPAADGALDVGALPQELLNKVEIVLDDGPVRHGRPSTIIRAGERDFQIVRQGVFDRRILEKMLQTTILFVCSGNTCRSPMAQAIARKVLADWLNVPEKQLEQAGYQVISAGTSTLGGSPAAAYAIEAVREYGADLSAHRSRPLTQQLISQATVIFVMAQNHADAVLAADPSASDKVMLLDSHGDIEDPIGGELALYKNLARKIKGVIENRLADRSLLGAGEVKK